MSSFQSALVTSIITYWWKCVLDALNSFRALFSVSKYPQPFLHPGCQTEQSATSVDQSQRSACRVSMRWCGHFMAGSSTTMCGQCFDVLVQDVLQCQHYGFCGARQLQCIYHSPLPVPRGRLCCTTQVAGGGAQSLTSAEETLLMVRSQPDAQDAA